MTNNQFAATLISLSKKTSTQTVPQIAPLSETQKRIVEQQQQLLASYQLMLEWLNN